MSRIKPEYNGCLLSCVIASDIHIDKKNPIAWFPKWLLRRALSDAKNAKIRQDAFISVGDNTSRGNAENWKLTEDCFAAVPGAAEHILLPLGNHDTWHDDYDAAIKEYYRAQKIICGRELNKQYFSQDIKGYKFIFMGSIQDVGDRPKLGEEQLKWLDEELADGAKDGKPVFVFNHQSLNCRHGLPNTYEKIPKPDWPKEIGGIGEESDAVESILKKYKNVFFFSGHSHMGLCSEGWQKEHGYSNFEQENSLVVVNLPSLSCGNHSGEDNRVGAGLVLEIYADKVLLRLRDFKTHKWMKNLIISNGKPWFEKNLELRD